MSTDLTNWLWVTSVCLAVWWVGYHAYHATRRLAAAWRRQSAEIDALLDRKHDGWEIDGHAKWDDRRDGPLPRTTDQAARYYDGLIERGEW